VQDITDRLTANEVLRVTQGRFETLSKLSPVGIYQTDRYGKCLYVNDKWCELSGLTTEQSLGLGWSDAISLEDRPQILHSWSEAAECTQPFSMEFRFLRPNGTMRWVVGQAAPQLDASGGVEGFIGAVTDITDQKTMQAALQASEGRLATAHKIASLGFYEWDMVNDSAVWSPEVDKVFGFPFNKIANTRDKYAGLIHPDDVQTWREAMGGRESSSEPVSSEYRLVLPDGSVRNVLGVGQIIKGKDGAPIRLNGTLQDITALRLTEASLRQITAEQRVILDHAQIGIAFIKDRRIVRSNDRLAIMLGRFPDGLDNAPIDEFFGGEKESAEFWATADAAFRIGVPHEAELLVKREDDSKTWIRVIGNAVNPTDPSEGSIWLVENVTRRKSAEDALRQSQKMDAVGQLSGGIAHDFNNLLGIIIGNLEILEQMPGMQETDRAWAERAKEAALRGADLTSRLLKFSSGAGKKRQLMVLNDAIVGMDNMLSRSLTSEIQIQTELAADLWLTELELSDFENAVVNLAVNARDAMPTGGILKIETANVSLDANSDRLDIDVPLGDYVLLTVSDTGTGMPADVIARVFDPFFTTKDQDKGTGLGLSMVYGFVDRSSGHIRIRSRLKQGTTFRMYLPRVKDLSAFGPALATQAKVDLPHGKEVVLVVDDEVSLSAPTAAQLTKLGYQVLTADSGPAALDVLRGDQKIDLIVSDIVMPGKMNGYDLARQAKKQFSDIGIVLTSGYTSKATLERAGEQEGGDFPFIAKPYEFEALALKIREVLDEPRP
ncbi:MAG: PAS domain-containing protein, partial [Rhodospirillales bacterium]|nr:PAS domain-containing protein [Rhodospirillales bacterium]